jgi:serine/threonine protein kinase
MSLYDCPYCEATFEAEIKPDEILFCPHCNEAVSLPKEEELPEGRVIGGFQVIKLLGKGGMGNVYLANQVSMGRLVALKVLPKALTRDKQSVEQFMNEVRLTGSLSHPHIVTAFYSGEENDVYYLAMTYIDGETLEEKIERDGPQSERQVIKWTLQIADALKSAWEKHQLLHKDIKPGNIMINKEGDAFLLDLGIAQHLGEQKKARDFVEGSPFYMSPEQTRGEKLDWSSDLYSLGASLYHLTVGVPPYNDPDIIKIVEMHTAAPFPEPGNRNPDADLSPGFTALLKKMMAKTPAERFASWADFIKDLSEAGKAKSLSRGKTKTSLKKRRALPGKTHKSLSSSYTPPAAKLRPLTLAIAGAALLAAAAAVFAGLKFYYQSAAEKKLSDARNYLIRPDVNYEIAVQMFQSAADSSDNFFVSRKFSGKIMIELEKIKTAASSEIIEEKSLKETIESFNLNISESMKLYKEKQYTAALDRVRQAEKNLGNFPFTGDARKKKVEELRQTAKTTVKKLESAVKAADSKNQKTAAASAAAPGKTTAPARGAAPVQTRAFPVRQVSDPPADGETPAHTGELSAKPDSGTPAPAADKPAAEPSTQTASAEPAWKTSVQISAPPPATPPPPVKNGPDYKKIKESVILKLVSREHSKRRDFDSMREALAQQASEDAGPELKKWTDEIASHITSAANLWAAARDSGEALAGKKIQLENIQNSEIVKVEGGKIHAKITEMKKDQTQAIVIKRTVKIEELSPDGLSGFLEIVSSAMKLPEDSLFSFFLLSGDYPQAKKFALRGDMKTDLSEFASVYFTDMLSKECAKGMDDPKVKKKIEFLKGKYSAFPEFDRALSKASSGSF